MYHLVEALSRQKYNIGKSETLLECMGLYTYIYMHCAGAADDAVA